MNTIARYSLNEAQAFEASYDPFDPQAYLREYYAAVGPENQALLRFFERAYRHIFQTRTQAAILEFGGGPTVYQLISAARQDVSIDISDFLDINLCEFTQWLHNTPDRFAWDAFFAYTLQLEGAKIDGEAVARRADLLRSKINRLLHCDARRAYPLEREFGHCYDIVSANFVLEAISRDVAEWQRMVANVMQLVARDGYVILSSIIGAQHYRVGTRFYPATPLAPEQITSLLCRLGFYICLEHEVEAEHGGLQGYDGLFMVLAQKCGPGNPASLE